MAANDVPCCEPMFWIYILICVALVMFAGLMSGLTLGLMSLSRVDLEVLIKAGQPQDRKNAAKILPIVKNQHLLLCTLLIGNSLAMEALPIFLDAVLPAWGAILISVTLILAFGEIIPQAVCSRYGLSVGAKMAVIVKLLVLVFFPISYPISKLLDYLLGKGHFALLRRAELKTLVDMHGNEAGKGGELTHDETTIITGALDLTQKTAKDAMTPISQTFSLDINSKLDTPTMGLIMSKGHSRIPIYSETPTNIVGLILVKNLIFCNPQDATPLRNATIRRIPRVPDHLPLYEILNEFQKGNSHIAVVVKSMKDVISTPESRKGSNTARKRMNMKQSHLEENGNDFHSVMAIPNSPSVNSETMSPRLRSIVETNKGTSPQLRKGKQRGFYDDIVDADLDSLSSYSPDEEVIGIITMEDVIEELLQEEIFDETDEYVDVHNKIRINMLMPRKSPPSSPSLVSPYRYIKQTPLSSPRSSYHHTPILHSPISPYVQSPSFRPSLSSSPARSSPVEFQGNGRYSKLSTLTSSSKKTIQ